MREHGVLQFRFNANGTFFRKESSMEGHDELIRHLIRLVGDEGCGGSCDVTSIFHDKEGWKLYLCSFMEPWFIGKTIEEAKGAIENYASMGFGLS
jgi:hypothetical protein